MKRKRLLALVSSLLLASSCAGGPDPLFVTASRDTYSAIAPEYMHYVQGDAALSAEQKTRRQATCDRWNEAITAREGK